ncbi:MAG: sigma-70 family RNA polymerase sigma factor [Hyphomicrobiaceae bacterium]|nr:sigma-70 family RNA polymerase sigma factor [Hyphomicrobiaceae bacterium]
MAGDRSTTDGEDGESAESTPRRSVGDPHPAASDDELVSRVARADEHAFGQVIDRHLSRVVAEARSIVRDAAEAEDIAQEAFLRLWRQAGQLSIGPHGARPWLVRVARNLAIDRLRAGRRTEVTSDVPEVAIDAGQLRDLEAGETGRKIDEALRGLPERQRLAVMLFHHEGLSLIETGNALGVSAEAVESLLARARRALRRDLAGLWRELKGGGEHG